MKAIVAVLVVALFVLNGVVAKSPAEWRTRSIYQILTDRFSPSTNTSNGCSNLSNYCGGTWTGISKRLDYIQGMGFNAIWISPIVLNTNNGYHGYWTLDFYKTNDRYGTEQELFNLLSECRRRDIWVMVDVVANHVGYQSRTGFSEFPQFNQASHYHSNCQINDWNNQAQVENCWLAGLPDLKQEDSYVSSELLKWITYLVSRYQFEGIRIDTVRHVPKSFWTGFQSAADQGGVSVGQQGTFAIGEVLNGDTAFVADYQNYLDSLLSFPLYYAIQNAFGYKQSLVTFGKTWRETMKRYVDPTILGNFIDNHDVVRFRYLQGDEALLRNALAWAMMAEGIPILYYGTEQLFAGGNDPANREIMWNSFNPSSATYKFLAQINALRAQLGSAFFDSAQQELYASNNVYIFTRTRSVNSGACGFSESSREDCGFVGITQSQCVQRGCCWTPSSSGAPYCYFPDTSTSYSPLAIVALTNAGNGNTVSATFAAGGNQARSLYDVLTGERFYASGNTFTISLNRGQPRVFRVD